MSFFTRRFLYILGCSGPRCGARSENPVGVEVGLNNLSKSNHIKMGHTLIALAHVRKGMYLVGQEI